MSVKTSEPDPVLVAQDVAVHYGGIKAVDGIDMRLERGKIVGILGPNGSGKSTLLAALTRLVPLTRGDLLLDGSSYRTDRAQSVARNGVARTFQTVRLVDGLTVRENVQLGTDVPRRHGRTTRATRASRVDEALERTGLTPVRDYLPDELSYGSQRRVEIARAIASDPHLLLLDEPTAGMNRQERNDITELLLSLRQDGLTQLLIEHDVQMMVDTCDYLYAMNFGVLIAEGEPAAVVNNRAVQEAYLGTRWSETHA
jgi:branched-chain amino acid transport system ATP-binding protein